PDERSLERVRDIIAMTRELAGDFRRVQDEFQELHRKLREQVMDAEGSRGQVLEKIFAGVDLLAESEEGRSFRAFWRLLTDPEQTLAFEGAIEQVLTRDFSKQMDRRERSYLRQVMYLLLENGAEVHEVTQQFARGLKQFVQSRAYQE